MDFLTKVVSFFSPRAAFERMEWQQAVKVKVDHIRKFDGASRGRRMGTWGLNNGTPNHEISAALPILRARSRELCSNNGYAFNAPVRIANNVVGTGILFTPVHKNGNQDSEKALKEAWKDWAESTKCDFDGQSTLYGLQHIAMKNVAELGECVIRRVYKPYKKGEIPFELQIIDPDFLDHSSHGDLSNGGYIINGVEYNQKGKRVAFHIFDRHPNEYSAKVQRVPAEEICVIYDKRFGGQVRGLPFFTPIILKMKDFDEFEDAELLKQKIAACFAGFRTKSSEQVKPGANDVDATGNRLERIQPGVIDDLLPGEEMIFANPPASNGYGEFTKQSLRGQAIATGLTYESYSGDLSNVNFSSGRMGWLESQRNFEHWQWHMLVPMFLTRVVDWFLDASLIMGIIPDNKFSHTWTPPRREMIDPTKEVPAKIKAIRAGLVSWQDTVRQDGYNPEEVLEEMKEDKDGFDKIGVLPECDPRYDPERMNKEEAAEASKKEDKD